MDTNTFNNLISQTWPDLHAASTLGGGTFGTVYACTKTDAVTGVTQKEAVKVVRVDFTPEDRANAEEEGIPFADYYRAVKEKRLQEIRWMVALKSPHIVHINGYTAIEEPDLSALYILIRMDCLTALDQLRPAHLDDTPEQAAALAQASDLLQGNENFMTAHNLQFCSDRTVTIPGGALVYLTDPEKIESDYPGYTTADDADVEAGDLTLTFTDVTAEDNGDGTVTYTIQLTERADITQRRTQDAPIYGVGARFATVLPFDAATGQVFPSLTEDWTPHRAYTVQMTATVDGHTYEMPINRDTTWQMESADGDVAATEQVDDLPGYGMPGLILRAAYVKHQTIMIKAPAASDLGLLVCTAPYDGYTEGDYENTPPVQALADTPGFAGYDKYWYFDLNELTKE